MDVQRRRGGWDLAVELAPHLDAWTATQPYTPHVHSGDVGWHLRSGPDAVDGTLLAWEVDDAPVAAGLLDAGVLRLAFAPGWSASEGLAAQVARECVDLEYVDALSGTALRQCLLATGWSADPDPWVVLHKDLGAADADHDDPASRPLDGPADVEARVAVQRSAFAPGSTFTPTLWRHMAAGPTYDGRFEQVAWTPDGRAAAAATGWFAGPGATAILEPVGTHREHRRQGYGRRVNLAVMAALARAGAGGIRVHTPASNEAAVLAYESCGLRRVDVTTAVTRVG